MGILFCVDFININYEAVFTIIITEFPPMSSVARVTCDKLKTACRWFGPALIFDRFLSLERETRVIYIAIVYFIFIFLKNITSFISHPSCAVLVLLVVAPDYKFVVLVRS